MFAHDNSDATRRRVLAAARRVMDERGIARLRVEAVAKEAGLSAGALYRHFSGREDLILAVILDSVPRVGVLADAAVAEPPVAAEALLDLVLGIYQHEQRMASVAITVLADDSLRRRFQQAVAAAPGGPQDFPRLVQQALERYQAAGCLRPGLDTVEAAATIQARCFHHAVMDRLHSTDGTEPTPTELAQALVSDLTT